MPDVLSSFFVPGKRVQDASDWSGWRRDEVLDVLEHYAYGPAPALKLVDVDVVTEASGLEGGAVDYVELLVRHTAGTAHVAIFAPAGHSGQRDVPAVLGPNRCGNHTVVADERIQVAPPAVDACGARGSDAEKWPVGQLAAAGLALVTFHQSELSVDDPELSAGLTLSIWAGGNSLALDALEAHATAVDATRVAVFGHSRRAKTALLTGARDPRIAAVVSHQAGTLGSSILRNDEGEPLVVITGMFPHWFAPLLSGFVGVEARLPFDQHHLLALLAPRPLLLVDGATDDWADPQGSLAAARAADVVWELLGSEGLIEEGGVPRQDAPVVWHLREGGHDVLPGDWDIFVAFLVRQLRP